MCIRDRVNSAHEYLDSERGILDNLAAAKDQLAAVVRYDERLHNACESLEGSWIALDECRRELSDYLSSEEYDAARAAYVEERLDLWYRLQKKYGDSYEAITAYFCLLYTSGGFGSGKACRWSCFSACDH